MGRPMSERPNDHESGSPDPGDRAAEVVDLFARDKAGGQNHGVHRVMQLVAKNDKGTLNTLANIIIIMAHDPPLAGMLGFNEFTDQPVLMRPPPVADDGEKPLPGPYPRPWGIADVALIQAYIQRAWISRAPSQAIENAMHTEAAHRRFHPVRDWLRSLKWDGKSRIDTWLHHAFGCPKDEYHAAIGAKFLIASVRRIRHPGCKFDHMPVLEGEQGIGKSSVCRELFGAAWFSDAIPEELASRDAALALLGVWLLEFAEIQHLIRNEVEVIKAFLSRSTDRYRPPYGKAFVEHPRHGVLIGTTNATDYLRDSSGNRRIWPVRCTIADVAWVTANRDHLWAEAAQREAGGEAIWLHEQEVQTQANVAQSDRMSEDVWNDAIAEWLHAKYETRIPDILTSALQIPRERQGKREEMRVATILTGLGWKRHVERVDGTPRRIWRPAV